MALVDVKRNDIFKVTSLSALVDNAVLVGDGARGIESSGITVNNGYGLVTTVPVGANTAGISVTQNDTTNNPRGIAIANAGTGNSIYIDANGNTGTTASSSGALFLDNTGNTGTGANFYTNGATVGSTGVLFAKVDNASASGPVARFDQDGTGNGLTVNLTNSGSGDAFRAVLVGTGNAISISDSGAKGTSDSGSGAILVDMTHATDVGMVVNVKTLNVATSHNMLRLNSAPAYSTLVNGAQTIDTTDTELVVDDTTGFPSSGTIRVMNNTSQTENARCSYIHYTSIDATHFYGTAGVFFKESTSISVVDNAIVEYMSTTQTASLAQFIDTSTNGGMVNLKLMGPNPDVEFVGLGGYDGSVGEGKFEIDVATGDNVTRTATDCLRINGRNDANNSFETIAIFTRPGPTRQGMVGIGFQNRLTPITLAAHLHVKNDADEDSGAASLVASIFEGASSQTADLTQWKSHAGAVLSCVTATGNLVLGTSAAGTTAANGVLALSNGATAPTASANLAHLYSADVAASACLALYQETAPVVAVATASTHKVQVVINGTAYFILLSNV